MTHVNNRNKNYNYSKITANIAGLDDRSAICNYIYQGNTTGEQQPRKLFIKRYGNWPLGAVKGKPWNRLVRKKIPEEVRPLQQWTKRNSGNRKAALLR